MVIQQLTDVQLVSAEALSETARGAGGFGSTGVKNN
jgi:dUTPase